jgi:hypothetical protein
VAASELGVSRDGSLVVIYGDNSEVIPYPSEEEITSALIHVANPEARKVYFLTGHGERDTQETGDLGYSQLQQALVSKDYEVGTLNLMTDAQVPEDALAVIIAGPLAPMSSEELESLRTYVESGGSLVLLQQPRGETEFGTQTDPLEAYLSETWGITLDDDLVVEPNSSNFLVAVSFRYGQHPFKVPDPFSDLLKTGGGHIETCDRMKKAAQHVRIDTPGGIEAEASAVDPGAVILHFLHHLGLLLIGITSLGLFNHLFAYRPCLQVTCSPG